MKHIKLFEEFIDEQVVNEKDQFLVKRLEAVYVELNNISIDIKNPRVKNDLFKANEKILSALQMINEFIDEQVVNEKASGDDEITITSVNIDHYYEILSTEKTDELDSIIPKDEKEFNIKIEMTKSGPILFDITGKKKDLLNFLRNKLDSTYAIKKRFPELYEEAGSNLKSQSYINENNPGDKLKHKYNPAIEIELIEPTNRGWKVYQIEKGKKKIAHFDKQDISGNKSLFQSAEEINEDGPVRYFLTVYLDKGLEMTYSAQELMTYVKDFNVAKDDLPRWLYQATLRHNKYSSENKNAVMRSQFPKLVRMDSEKIRYLLELIANHIFNRRENVEINISKDQSPALWYIAPKAVANNSFLHTS